MAQVAGVVVRPSDVGVTVGQGELGLWVVGLVEAGGEDGLDGSVAAQGPEPEGAVAGGLQALRGIGAEEPHEAEAGAVALLGVSAGLEELFDEGGRVRSGLVSPAYEP